MRHYLVIFLLAIGGCANLNPYQVSEENAATLQSRLLTKNEEGHSLIFVALDGQYLNPGWGIAPVNAAFKAPSGKRNLVIRLVHRPAKVGLFSPGYSLFAAQAALSAELVAGRTYIADADVLAGIAKIWVKDATDGHSVSEVVTHRLTPLLPESVSPIFIPVK